jgi:putative ABC transport system permease protein
MNFIAMKMLFGDRAKYIGIIVGLTFASLLITQQSAIFAGIMTRTFSFLLDVGLPDIWVVDPHAKYIDDIKPIQDTQVLRVRSVEGVQWAVPLYKGSLSVRLKDGTYQTCTIVGLDDETLMGGPPNMLSGDLSYLRRSGAVIVDATGAAGKLAHIRASGESVPLKVGEEMEINDNQAVVVGTCNVTQTFQNVPVLYMTYSSATLFAPGQRLLLSFVCVKAKPGQNLHELCRRIELATGLSAYTRNDFKMVTFLYYMKYTGMPINFLTAVALGFLVGVAISGQTFYNFTLDNLRYFGTLKAMGARNGMLLRMILLQALVVGAIGYGLGVGAASAWGMLIGGHTQLAFRLPWQLLVVSAVAVLVICLSSAAISIRKVMKLEPAVVFRS